MEHKQNYIFQFITWTFLLFTADILMMIIIAALFGEQAKSMSTMFQFGSKGLASTTMLQFLLSACITVLLKDFFYNELIFKHMMALWRTIFMLLSILIVHIVFILVFGWFPYANKLAWTSFFICFGGSFVLCSLVMILKTKLESKHYDELLNSYKEQRKGDEDE
jgi:hypothetical protein